MQHWQLATTHAYAGPSSAEAYPRTKPLFPAAPIDFSPFGASAFSICLPPSSLAMIWTFPIRPEGAAGTYDGQLFTFGKLPLEPPSRMCFSRCGLRNGNQRPALCVLLRHRWSSVVFFPEVGKGPGGGAFSSSSFCRVSFRARDFFSDCLNDFNWFFRRTCFSTSRKNVSMVFPRSPPWPHQHHCVDAV